MVKAWHKTIIKTGLVVAFAGAMAACSSYKDNVIAPAPLTKFKPQVAVLKDWQTQVGDGSGEPDRAVFSYDNQDYWLYGVAQDWHLNVTRDGSTLYAADYNGLVKALNLQGKTQWQAQLSTQITTPPVAGRHALYLVSAQGDVIALNKNNGKQLWKKPLNTLILAAVAVAPQQGVVVVHSKAGVIFGLSTRDGHQLWRYDPLLTPPMSMEGSSVPIIADGKAVVGSSNGEVVALDVRSGDVVWQSQVAVASGASEVAQIVDIDASPVVRNNTVYVTSVQDKTAALSLQTGQIIWQHKLGSYSGLAVAGNKVIVTANNGALWALDRSTGKPIWVDSSLLGRHPTTPAVVDGKYVIVGDFKGFLHWFSLSDGKLAGRLSIGERSIVGKPVVYQGKAYVMSASGRLVAVSGSSIS